MKIYSPALFFSCSLLAIHGSAVAQVDENSPGANLLRIAEKKALVTSDAEIISPYLDKIQRDRISLWDRREALITKLNNLSAVEKVISSAINIEIESSTLRIKELDAKRRAHLRRRTLLGFINYMWIHVSRKY